MRLARRSGRNRGGNLKASVYQRPNKPKHLAVQRRGRVAERLPAPLPEPVIVHSSTECHVTPPEVAESMVYYLGEPGRVLEPSAGTGNLVHALQEAGYTDILAIEREFSLMEVLKMSFEERFLLNTDFLEYAASTGETFPRILMNPPFRGVRHHMKAALSLLAPGGVLVALVPITYTHEDAEQVEVLGPDTFSSAKVNTQIVRFYHGYI